MPDYYERADLLYSAKQYKQAEEVAKLGLSEDNEDCDLLCLLSSIQDKLSKRRECLETAQRAVQVDGNYARAHRVLASALAENYQLDKAIDAIDRAIALDPEDASLHAFAAWIYGCNHKYEEGLVFANKSIELDPGSTRGLEEKSLILRAMKRTEEAEEITESLLQSQPMDFRLHLERGYIARTAMEPKEMFEHFQKALEIRPDSTQSHFAMACAYQAQGDYQNAEKFLKSALDIDEKELSCSLVLAEVYLEQKKLSDALDCLQKARGFYPEDQSVLTKLCEVALARTDEKLLGECALKLHETHPELLEGVSYLLYFYYLSKAPAKGDKLIEDYLTSHPNTDHEILLNASRAEYKQDGAALEHWSKLGLERDEKSNHYLKKLLLSYINQAKSQEVIDMMDSHPDIFTPAQKLTALADIARVKNDFKEVEKYLLEALALEPDNGEIKDALCRNVFQKTLNPLWNLMSGLIEKTSNWRKLSPFNPRVPVFIQALLTIPFCLYVLLLLNMMLFFFMLSFLLAKASPATRSIKNVPLFAKLKYFPVLFFVDWFVVLCFKYWYMLIYPIRTLFMLFLVYLFAKSRLGIVTLIMLILTIIVTLGDIRWILNSLFHPR